MAVTFVGAGAIAAGDGVTSLLASTHADTLTGDIIIAQVMLKTIDDNIDISPPDGSWTEFVTQDLNITNAAGAIHQYACFWKRSTADGAQDFTFTKDSTTGGFFIVLSSWRGCLASGSPIDATAPGVTETATNADNVSFPAFDPTLPCHVVYMAFYGDDNTTFSAAMSADTNPDCTLRYDLETGTGSDGTLACISGDSDGSNIAARTWASNSTTNVGNTGVVFGLVPAAASKIPLFMHHYKLMAAA